MTDQKSQALVKHTPQQLRAASQSLTALAQLFGEGQYNLLAPTVHMEIPRGMRLAITEVRVSPICPKYGAGEDVAPISGGKLLVLKHKLDQIANGAGISWMSERRVDGGLHPHYFEVEVKGRITDYDGTVRDITGSKTIDLRESVDGVPGKDYDEIVSKARAANNGKGRDYSKQLLEARKFGAEICASKAKNRAIAQALGIKRSYSPAELSKPFVIPKLMLDSGDADAKELIMANMVGATDALYGSRTKGEVIDVPFEEVATEQTVADLRDPRSGRIDLKRPDDGETPAHDPQTGEVLSPAESLRASFNEFKAGGGKPEDFKALFSGATGKTESAGADDNDAENVASAVRAYIANSGDDQPEQGGLGF